MDQPFVRVLGSADWLPTQDNDGSCYTLNDHLQIDTGYSATVNLINRGFEPISLNTLLFTHMHADHCIGLTQLLLYWRIRRGSMADLTVAGPAETVEETFMEAFRYVFHDSPDPREEVRELPRFVKLRDGDALETADFHITACDSQHAVPGVCYRVTHKSSGHTVGFTGDTAYRSAFADFFKGVDLLIHEASFGATPVTPDTNKTCKHSSAHDAARVAEECGAKALLLTHSRPVNREAALKVAREKLSIPVEWAMPWHTFEY